MIVLGIKTGRHIFQICIGIYANIISGFFVWSGHDFTAHAQQGTIHFQYEQQPPQPILRARLEGFPGSYTDRDVNLSQRIFNDHGDLKL